MFAAPRFARVAWVAWAFAASWPSSGPAATWRVTVRGNGTDLGETPVVTVLSQRIPPGNYQLQPADGAKPLPAFVFDDDGQLCLGVVLGHVAGNKPESYTLRAAPDSSTASGAGGIVLRREGSNVTALVARKLLTEYLADSGPKPYYFPVIGPTGEPITRAYPMKQVAGEDRDHPHQRSLWFTHGNVNGIDFWSEQGTHGTIRETAKKAVVAGPAVGLIHTTDEWLGPDGRKVCDDERVVRFYDTATARVFDFDITLKSTAGPVTFGDTKEGMFGLRVASSMDAKRKPGGRITNAEGLTDDAAWGKASPWVDYTGPVAGRTVGVAILNHPDSFRYPTTWHVRTYGLFAANPFGWHDFGRKESGAYALAAGESIRFRYRLILHEGDTASADLPRAFEAYAHPPAIEVAAE
jgi:hypothetical protein